MNETTKKNKRKIDRPTIYLALKIIDDMYWLWCPGAETTNMGI